MCIMYLLLLPDSVRIVFVTFNELGVFKERLWKILAHANVADIGGCLCQGYSNNIINKNRFLITVMNIVHPLNCQSQVDNMKE